MKKHIDVLHRKLPLETNRVKNCYWW